MIKKVYSLTLVGGYFFALMVLFTACPKEPEIVINKDSCTIISCENGGICLSGICQCPPGFSGENCEIKDEEQEEDTRSIQVRLDEGESPISIFNSGITLDSIYGRIFQGGYIFHLDESEGFGRVALRDSDSPGAAWGCFGSSFKDDFGVSLGVSLSFGYSNTETIANTCQEEGTAAKISFDFVDELGYNDWHLPSKFEVDLMYTNLLMVTVMVNGTPPSYTAEDGYEFNWYISQDRIYIQLHPTNSFNILNAIAKVVFMVHQ